MRTKLPKSWILAKTAENPARRRICVLAVFSMCLPFSLPTFAVAPPKQDVADAVRQFTHVIPYETNDRELRKIVDGYHAGSMYIAIRAETTGLDNAVVNNFSCASTSLWHFFSKLFGVPKNQSFTIDARFNVGGYEIGTLPILMLSDVEGNCKYVAVDSKQLVPFVKRDANTTVEITFTIRKTNSRDFKLIDNFRPAVSAIAAAYGSTRLVSELAQPVFTNASKAVADLYTNSSLTDVSGQVTTSFDSLHNKGLEFSPEGGGASLRVRLLIDPSLSIYTRETSGDDKSIRPKYPPALNVYSAGGIYSVNQNGNFVSVSVRDHLQKDSTGRALLARLQSSPVSDFSASCDEIRAELQDRLRLSEGDMLENFFYILQRTHWYDDAAFRGTLCVSPGDIEAMRLLGIPVNTGNLSRQDSLTVMNAFMDRFSRNLHFGGVEEKKIFFERVLAESVTVDDPSGLLFTSANDKSAAIRGITQNKVAAFACYSTSVDQPPVVRTALIVTSDEKSRASFTVEVAKFGADSTVAQLKAVSVAVVPLDNKDPEAISLLTRIVSGQPTDGCRAVLKQYFKDFPGAL